jgi:hypothetical protein
VNVLRLSQQTLDTDNFLVDIEFDRPNTSRQLARAKVEFSVSAQVQENIRWYLEEYLMYPQDPAPRLAAQIEQKMSDIGEALFSAVFLSDGDTQDLWAKVRDDLVQTCIEIATDVRGASTLPWELLRDPRTQTFVALRAHSFVHTYSQSAIPARIPTLQSDNEIRILLVIARPRGEDDVPFRSVASRILKEIEVNPFFSIDVLRPPTFEQLSHTLNTAYQSGRPYHIVHFDGHGVFVDGTDAIVHINPHTYRIRDGKHGYIVFENPIYPHNWEFIGGAELGNLLVETGVPILVLNACRSAHAEPPRQPQSITNNENSRQQVHAFGSFAQEIVNTGVAGVVAMRYNVFVVTAAQFVSGLYSNLARGVSLGEAVTQGRRQLASTPARNITYTPIDLQDWLVPIVYEAFPIRLVQAPLSTNRSSLVKNSVVKNDDVVGLPEPDTGFIGRDEILLEIDRAFDNHPLVLVTGYAGIGKTSTISEFARWYIYTTSSDTRVIFTSFEYYRPFVSILADFGQKFKQYLLQAESINWDALSTQEQRRIVLQTMQQIPCLWIWDNIETVNGFPSNSASLWKDDEQQELLNFLRAVQHTKAKVLLTSRRDEEGWLGNLPYRLQLPPMHFADQLLLAKTVAEKRGHRITDVDNWISVLRYAHGHPLMTIVLVNQVIKLALRTKEEIADFVRKLQLKELSIDDPINQGRERSLAASLSYGFESTFSDIQLKRLALLHLFQVYVDIFLLVEMGNPQNMSHLPNLVGFSEKEATILLAAAAEIGLLVQLPNGDFHIHPAVSWHFQSLFEKFYPSDDGMNALYTYVELVGRKGADLARRYTDGDRYLFEFLFMEEKNLIHAHYIARENLWFKPLIATTQGLSVVYEHMGRVTEFKQVVDDILPLFVDPTSDRPLSGDGEKYWYLVNDYRVYLAKQQHDFALAEHLHRIRLEWTQQKAEGVLALSLKRFDHDQKHAIRSFTNALLELGNQQMHNSDSDCFATYRRAMNLAQRLQDSSLKAVIAYNWGVAFMEVSEQRDLDKAKFWLERSLQLRSSVDVIGTARCFRMMGKVYMEMASEYLQKVIKKYGRIDPDNLKSAQQRKFNTLLSTAERNLVRALETFPSSAVSEVAKTYAFLCELHAEYSDIHKALTYGSQGIARFESIGDIYHASTIRYDLAKWLYADGGYRGDATMFQIALEYANAALQGFVSLGSVGVTYAQGVQVLIDLIEEDMN